MKLIAIVVALVFSGCVWTPAHQSSHQQHLPVVVAGYASAAGATIHIRSWNYRLNRLVEVATVRADTAPSFEDPDMYYWEHPGIRLGRDHWALPGMPCSAGGMAQLRVYEGNATSSLPTFTAGAQDCVYDEILDGNHPARAGYECSDADQIVLFDPDGC